MLRRLASIAAIAMVVLLTSSVPDMPLLAPRARAAAPPPPVLVVQMNLCNSGFAIKTCYRFGRSVDEAVGRIHRYRPDVVTLQEICEDNVFEGDGWAKLTRAMADLYGGQVSAEFVPAVDRYTGDWYRCTNGARYGIGLMYHGRGGDQHHGWYGNQDRSGEIRAWACATIVPGRLTACTTHLTNRADVAARQCRELMAILASPWVMPEVVVGADLNLGPADARSCLAPGFARTGDGSLQHVVYRSMTWTAAGTEPMRYTDHPLLYARLTLR
jgi:Endonuclease/Exonuclease/phosphatase family